MSPASHGQLMMTGGSSQDNRLTMPKEVKARYCAFQRLNSVVLAGLQWVCASIADRGGQAKGSHGAHVDYQCDSESSVVSGSPAGNKGIGSI
jgi:hypothetical protein